MVSTKYMSNHTSLGMNASERPPHVHVDFSYLASSLLTASCSTNRNSLKSSPPSFYFPSLLPCLLHLLSCTLERTITDIKPLPRGSRVYFLSSILALFFVTYISPIHSLPPAPPSLRSPLLKVAERALACMYIRLLPVRRLFS